MPNFSDAGSTLLQQLEGLRLEAYDDATGRPPGPDGRVLGRLTIGYGHTGEDVVPGLVWSIDDAVQHLQADTQTVANQLIDLVTFALSNNQFSALVCLGFNIGAGAVAGSSALKLANQGRLSEVPSHIQLWNKVEIGNVLRVSPGLVGRRAAEAALWLLPDDSPIPDFGAIRDAAARASTASQTA